MGVRIGCGLSTRPDTRGAAQEAAVAAGAALEGRPADLVLVFASGGHLADPFALLDPIGNELSPAALSGCGASGVVGGGREVDGGSGVSVWAAHLAGGHAESFIAEPVQTELGTALTGLPDPTGSSGVLLFPDPYSLPTDALLRALEEASPGSALVGGLPSARTLDGGAALFCDDAIGAEGVCGAVLHDVDLQTCVSQGAVPLGPELTITAGEGHVIAELAGRPALERIRETLMTLEPAERELVEHGLLLGIVVETGQPEYGRGDFVVRGVLGADPESGSVTVGAPVSPGQVVRLHARDLSHAGTDLRCALAEAEAGPAAGALVFACQSRGADRAAGGGGDADAVARALDGAPAAGFHAAGEIGPLHGHALLHGFTATVAVFRP